MVEEYCYLLSLPTCLQYKSLTGQDFIHLYLAFDLHNDHSVDRRHLPFGSGYHVRRDLGQVTEMREVFRQTQDTSYYRYNEIRMFYFVIMEQLRQLQPMAYFKMRVLTWRHYTRAARVVPAVMSLPAKCARAEVMPIYQDPVFCIWLAVTDQLPWPGQTDQYLACRPTCQLGPVRDIHRARFLNNSVPVWGQSFQNR